MGSLIQLVAWLIFPGPGLAAWSGASSAPSGAGEARTSSSLATSTLRVAAACPGYLASFEPSCQANSPAPSSHAACPRSCETSAEWPCPIGGLLPSRHGGGDSIVAMLYCWTQWHTAISIGAGCCSPQNTQLTHAVPFFLGTSWKAGSHPSMLTLFKSIFSFSDYLSHFCGCTLLLLKMVIQLGCLPPQ